MYGFQDLRSVLDVKTIFVWTSIFIFLNLVLKTFSRHPKWVEFTKQLPRPYAYPLIGNRLDFFTRARTYLWPLFRRIVIVMLKSTSVPRHINLIPDGNRTYAKKVGITLTEAYDKGLVDTIIQQIRTCSELNIEIITLYVFTEKNFKRDKSDIEPAFQAFVRLFGEIIKQPYGGRYKVVGNLAELPDYILSVASEMENTTRENNRFSVFFTLNYFGITELSQIALNIQNEISPPTTVTPELIDKFTYIPHDDSTSTLTIRTSGNKRLSGDLPWQNAFSTIYFLDKLWPELSECDLFKAILYFQHHHNRCSKAADYEDLPKMEHNKCEHTLSSFLRLPSLYFFFTFTFLISFYFSFLYEVALGCVVFLLGIAILDVLFCIFSFPIRCFIKM